MTPSAEPAGGSSGPGGSAGSDLVGTLTWREAAERKGQVGGGGRSEKIRTYNFKENRVTDHRIGLTIYKLDKVLAGELDDVVDALVADEQAHRLQHGG